MPSFNVTALAGREVAGKRNPGAGETITLSEKQAEHPLRLGHIERPVQRKVHRNKPEAKTAESED